MKLQLIIYFTIFIMLISSFIFNIYRNKFRIDLFTKYGEEKFLRNNYHQLYIKRKRNNFYPKVGFTNPAKEVPINSYEVHSSNSINTVYDELFLFEKNVKGIEFEIFRCQYSEANKIRIYSLVNKYEILHSIKFIKEQ